MVISNHHPVPAPLSFLPALVGKYQASIFVERNANALTSMACSPHVLFAVLAFTPSLKPKVTNPFFNYAFLYVSRCPCPRRIYCTHCSVRTSSVRQPSSPYKILGLPDIFSSSREVRGLEHWQTQRLSQRGLLSGLVGKLVQVAKKIIPHHESPAITPKPAEPAVPVKAPAPEPAPAPAPAAPPAAPHPDPEKEPTPSKPQEPDPVPSQPPKSWKEMGKTAAIDFGIGAAGTLAGDEILSTRPNSTESANSTDSANSIDSAGPTSLTNSTNPIDYSTSGNPAPGNPTSYTSGNPTSYTSGNPTSYTSTNPTSDTSGNPTSYTSGNPTSQSLTNPNNPKSYNWDNPTSSSSTSEPPNVPYTGNTNNNAYYGGPFELQNRAQVRGKEALSLFGRMLDELD